MNDGSREHRPLRPIWWRPERVDTDGDGREVSGVVHRLADDDDETARAQRRIQGAVIAARVRRLSSPSVTVYEDGPVERWFHGHCVGNTLCLLDELSRRGITCRPVTGAHRGDVKRRLGGERRPTTAQEAVEKGVQHHWAEARLDGTWWTVDPALYRHDSADGKPYVGLKTPGAYRTFPDSRSFAAAYFDRVQGRIEVEVVGSPTDGTDAWDMALARVDP